MLVIDRFLSIDIAFAGTSAAIFWYINMLDYTVMLNDVKKNIIDYLVAVVFTLNWIRVFGLF